jgi:hypothetical protein
VKLGSGSCPDQVCRWSGGRQGDRDRDNDGWPPAITAEEASAIGCCCQRGNSLRFAPTPAGRELAGGSKGGGIGCRLGPGHSQARCGQPAEPEGEGGGQGHDPAEQDPGAARRPAPGSHRSTRMAARATSTGSGRSGPTSGRAVGLR